MDIKKHTTNAILAVALFVFTYVFLLILSLFLVVGCIAAGLYIISNYIGIYSLLPGIALIIFSVLILIFLIKFMFKEYTVDRSDLIEIETKDAPDLYVMIKEIVKEVDTKFPKKIYLSHAVNASVFYDSTFWSMFLPIKKNLVIGLGLVNTATEAEFKAVLAHEFGHFSQRSMKKLGSYVYNVNKIIYNLLNDNEEYDNFLRNFEHIGSFIRLAMMGASAIIRAIQLLLEKLYQIVNINYLGLSRVMEFQADEVAARSAGAEPFINILLRTELSHSALQNVISYYEQRATDNTKPENIYPQHIFVVQELADDMKLSLVHGLPNLNTTKVRRYRTSKLNLEDQWASHPSTEDRVKALRMSGTKEVVDQGIPASRLFKDIHELEKAVTTILFSQIQYKKDPEIEQLDKFKENYLAERKQDAFPELFNGYYDLHPVFSGKEQVRTTKNNLKPENLYADDKIALIYAAQSLQNDINVLTYIGLHRTPKGYEYAGVKYNLNETGNLILELEKELEQINNDIAANDECVYNFFMEIAQTNSFKGQAHLFSIYNNKYSDLISIYLNMAEKTNFINVKTPFSRIEENIFDLSVVEKKFKAAINQILQDPAFEINIDPNTRQILEEYSARDYVYFVKPVYIDSALAVMFKAMSSYYELVNGIYVSLKTNLLNEMSSLYSVQFTELAKDSSHLNY